MDEVVSHRQRINRARPVFGLLLCFSAAVANKTQGNGERDEKPDQTDWLHSRWRHDDRHSVPRGCICRDIDPYDPDISHGCGSGRDTHGFGGDRMGPSSRPGGRQVRRLPWRQSWRQVRGGKVNGVPAANLTPTGIGKWSEADFAKALRMGIRPDGRILSAVMPWPYTRNLMDDEIRAMWMYVQTVRPRPTGG
jgi:hypothetical protein